MDDGLAEELGIMVDQFGMWWCPDGWGSSDKKEAIIYVLIAKNTELRDKIVLLRMLYERFRQWDRLDLGDGPYWRREIETALKACE